MIKPYLLEERVRYMQLRSLQKDSVIAVLKFII